MTNNPSPPGASAGERKWYLKWWTVLIWLATIGPFGFPFLWKSKDFNFFWKIFLTLLIVVLTVVLSWGTWRVIQVTIDQFRAAGLM